MSIELLPFLVVNDFFKNILHIALNVYITDRLIGFMPAIAEENCDGTVSTFHVIC